MLGYCQVKLFGLISSPSTTSKSLIPGLIFRGHRKVCSQNYSKGPKSLGFDFNAAPLRFCKSLPCQCRAVLRLERVTIRPR